MEANQELINRKHGSGKENWNSQLLGPGGSPQVGKPLSFGSPLFQKTVHAIVGTLRSNTVQ